MQQTQTPRAWLWLAAIAAATVIAYSPVLFNWFAGDDFVHLIWLKDAVHNWELVWRNFHSSWLDGTTTKFYRPLISVFMVTDYLAWGTNGLGFHLTNLFFHLSGSLFVYLIMRDMGAQDFAYQSQGGDRHSSSNSVWPLAAAAIFALYPLHPEAVSWITGRVDSIVTTFCLASVWCYMRWRASGSALAFLGSVTAFILGLLSKEMAITVPAVLVAYELSRHGLKFIKPALRTLPFWAIIGGYFVVRRMALGTFVGGYDDSLLFIADVKAFVLGWLHALRMTLVPLNRELFGAHHIATKLWEISLTGAVIAGVISAWKNKQHRPTLVFLVLWLGLCLVPVYKIFAIADDLQGSRLAYLATVPISCLLAFGLSTLRFRISGLSPAGTKDTSAKGVNALMAVAFSSLCAFVLYNNNQPWRQAGLESNAIHAALEGIYAGIDSDPQTLVIGLPDQIHGAYVCRNALWGMLKKPQFSKDVANCLMVNEFEPVQPFGFLKDSMLDSRDNVRIFNWRSDEHSFQPLPLAETGELTSPLPLTVRPAIQQQEKLKPVADIELPNGTACWNIDFVRVNLQVDQLAQSGNGADLVYMNNVAPKFALSHRAHAELAHQTGPQSVLFSLRGLPQWAFGSTPATLQLLLPPGCKATVVSAEAVPAATVLPRISFKNCGYMGTKGYLHLGKSEPLQRLFVDATAVPCAATTELEITRANLMFEDQNCSHFSKMANALVPGPSRGFMSLDVKDFKSPGIYEARVWARDSEDHIVGLASDHIVIAVDP
jgi:hypothetical protein